MNTRAVALVLAFWGWCSLLAQQPLNLCCFPDDIINWSPGSNADDAFNVAKVPLMPRFREPVPMKANSAQYYDGQLCNASILYPMCGECPSQGTSNYVTYQPTYWQYIDKMIYWAGSAGEGIINIPPAPSTDAAHINGVKILGNLFFPPVEFGGRQEWVQQMLTCIDGRYPYAAKLYELCSYFGFDGWFINEETGGGTTEQWCGFFDEFYNAAAADGNTSVELQWYNAQQTPDVALLTRNAATSQFLQYGIVGDNRLFANMLGCSKQDTFYKLYSGIECSQTGLTGYADQLRLAFRPAGHVGSVELFCPEENTWRANVRDFLGYGSDSDAAFNAACQTFADERTMWTNSTGNPANLDLYTWPGISGCIIERTAIASLPFTTNFCVGMGHSRYVDGVVRGSAPWFHSGVQGVMPTWRYWLDGDAMQVSLCFDDAFSGGNSIRLAGTLAQGLHLWRLFKTGISTAEASAVVRLAYKTSASLVPSLALSTASSVAPDTFLQPSSLKEINGWSIAEYSLDGVVGSTVYMLALQLDAPKQYDDYWLHLGALSVLPTGYQPKSVTVADFAVSINTDGDATDARLTWHYDYSTDFSHFDIFLIDGNGIETLVGQTRDEAFYIAPSLFRSSSGIAQVMLVPVLADGSRQQPLRHPVDIKPSSVMPIYQNIPTQCTLGSIYTLDGRRISSLQPGINIVKQADGTVHKTLQR